MKNPMKNLESVTDSQIQYFAEKTNRVFCGVKHQSKLLFKTVTNAFDQFGHDRKSWSLYKASVDVDRSSINKMTKILNCKVVRRNFESLPESWLVLHKITLLDESSILNLLNSGELSRDTKDSDINKILKDKKEAMRVKTSSAVAVTTPSNVASINVAGSNFVTVDYRTIKIGDLAKLTELLSQLEEYGFAIEHNAYEVALAA